MNEGVGQPADAIRQQRLVDREQLRNVDHRFSFELRMTPRQHQGELIRMMIGRSVTEMFPARPTRKGEAAAVVELADLCTDVLRGVTLAAKAGEILGRSPSVWEGLPTKFPLAGLPLLLN